MTAQSPAGARAGLASLRALPIPESLNYVATRNGMELE
jgi:hypothetical protein